MISLAVFIPISGWVRQTWHTFGVRLCRFGLYWRLCSVLALPQPEAVCHRAFCARHYGSDDGARRASAVLKNCDKRDLVSAIAWITTPGAHRTCSRFACRRFSRHLSFVALDIFSQHPDWATHFCSGNPIHLQIAGRQAAGETGCA